MTSLLPKTPARPWHPSQWNLIGPRRALGLTRAKAAVVGSLAAGACADDTTASDRGSETDTTDQTDYSDYQGDGYNDGYQDGYSDWDDDYSDYSDGYWYGECYVPEDCGPGMDCVGNYCVPLSGECATSNECAFDEFCDDNGSCVGVELPSQCLAPALEQIPLPEEAGGVVVALRFVELDGDPGRELLLLRDDALVVVDGDQSATIPHTGFALDGLAATDVDDDGFVDVIATSSTKLNARVFLANGLGGFIDTGTGPGMMLDDVHGIDWPSAGPGELLVRTQADQPAILSNFMAAMAEVELLADQPVEGVAAGDFDGNGDDDYVLLINCQPLIQVQGGDGVGSDGIGPAGACSLRVGDFDQDPRSDLAILRSDESFSVVTVWSPPEQSFVVGLIGAYAAAQPTEFGGAGRTVLVQSGPELELLFADDGGTAWCRGLLDDLPPVAAFVTGDFDGDEEEELAVLGVDGVVTLWSD